MRKIYLFMLAMFCITFTYAQQVELVGVGIFNKTFEAQGVVDDANLVSVTLFSVYLKSGGPSPVHDVVLADNSESENVSFTEIPPAQNYGPLPEAGLGYYGTVFDDEVDANGETITVHVDNIFNTYSLYAFVERDDPNADYYSVTDYTHIHCWANGAANPHTYTLPLLTNGLNRNISIEMPFSGLENNQSNLNRKAVVEIEADGMTTIVHTFTGNNGGDYYHQFSSGTFAVPAVATELRVKVYSPDEPWNGDIDPRPKGDSFMCGGVVADVTDVQEGPNCTYTQGYWKTHSTYGPAGPADETWEMLSNGPDTEFYLSGDSWHGVFWTPVKGNKYYSLAHQFMAAHLNFLSGADPSDAQAAYDAAKQLFMDHTPAQVKASKSLNKEFGSYIGTLTDYNEGTIGPGHCDDGEGDEKSASINTTSEEMLVYPNPISTNGTIEFKVANDGLTVVEVYNMMGAKVATLYDQNVQAGQKINVRFNVSDYTKGLYVVYIRNGSSIQKRKITIVN